MQYYIAQNTNIMKQQSYWVVILYHDMAFQILDELHFLFGTFYFSYNKTSHIYIQLNMASTLPNTAQD